MADSTTKIETEKRLRWVPISKTKINPLAQRELNEAWAEHLSLNFDLEKMATPVLNLRDGHFYIIDGQHTIEALKLIGWGDQQIECWVYQGLTTEEEAEKFLSLNDRRQVPSVPRFKAAVHAEREEESDIDRIVRAQGLVVTRDKVPGAVGAVATLQRVYRRSDGKTLGRTLRIIRDAFGDAGLDAPIIDGLGHVCQRYNGQLDDAALIERLANMNGGAGGLLNKANVIRKQTGNARGMCVAAAAVETFNAGRRAGKLPDWWKS